MTAPVTGPNGPLPIGELAANVAEGIATRAANDRELFDLARKLRLAGVPREEARQRLLEAARRLNPPIPEQRALQQLGRFYEYERAGESALREAETPSGKKQVLPQPLALRPIGELLREDPSDVQWLVEQLLPAGGVSILAGKPKSGKSTLARALAVCVAQGRPWLGRRTVQGPVFYLALDRDPRTALKEHFEGLGAKPEDPIFLFDQSVPVQAIASLRAAAEKQKPVLIVIDTMQRLLRSRDLNAYSEVTTALDPLIALARECRAHVLLLHHVTKGERADLVDCPLGSAAITGSVDTILILRRKDQVRTLASIQRYGDDLPETVIALDESREPQLTGTWAEHETTEAGNAILGFLAGRPEGATEADIR
jgi:hypothetical protein